MKGLGNKEGQKKKEALGREARANDSVFTRPRFLDSRTEEHLEIQLPRHERPTWWHCAVLCCAQIITAVNVACELSESTSNASRIA